MRISARWWIGCSRERRRSDVLQHSGGLAKAKNLVLESFVVGGVAQLGERRVRNAKVGSSILLLSTTKPFRNTALRLRMSCGVLHLGGRFSHVAAWSRSVARSDLAKRWISSTCGDGTHKIICATKNHIAHGYDVFSLGYKSTTFTPSSPHPHRTPRLRQRRFRMTAQILSSKRRVRTAHPRRNPQPRAA